MYQGPGFAYFALWLIGCGLALILWALWKCWRK